jgi:hypothetical protein
MLPPGRTAQETIGTRASLLGVGVETWRGEAVTVREYHWSALLARRDGGAAAPTRPCSRLFSSYPGNLAGKGAVFTPGRLVISFPPLCLRCTGEGLVSLFGTR